MSHFTNRTIPCDTRAQYNFCKNAVQSIHKLTSEIAFKGHSLLSSLSLLETDYKCVDYGRDSGYCKHCSEPTIVCTICTNQFFLIKLIKRRKSLKMISKMSFNKLNTNFRLEHYVRRKNRTAFLDVPFLLPETFHCNGKKSCVPFTFHPDFPETFFSV